MGVITVIRWFIVNPP